MNTPQSNRPLNEFNSPHRPETRQSGSYDSTPDWIDSLIDGELSPAKEAEAIAACEAFPDRWRCVAIGFLERRMIANAFRPELDSSSGRHESNGHRVTLLTKTSQRVDRGYLSHRVLQLAATALLCTTVGWTTSARFGGGFRNSAQLEPQIVGDETRSGNSVDNEPEQPVLSAPVPEGEKKQWVKYDQIDLPMPVGLLV